MVEALDAVLSTSGTVRNDPRVSELRPDLDVTETLKVFERELAAIHVDARAAQEAWRLEADRVEYWKKAQRAAEAEGEAFFAEHAIWAQRSQELLASERRLELEEWEQLVTDYSVVIEMLKVRLAG